MFYTPALSRPGATNPAAGSIVGVIVIFDRTAAMRGRGSGGVIVRVAVRLVHGCWFVVSCRRPEPAELNPGAGRAYQLRYHHCFPAAPTGAGIDGNPALWRSRALWRGRIFRHR